jgi:hypothetical protein
MDNYMLRVLGSANQTIYLHRKWNHKKYCIPTSIVKLNICETCASSLFFLFHFTGMSHSNAWPGTASILYKRTRSSIRSVQRGYEFSLLAGKRNVRWHRYEKCWLLLYYWVNLMNFDLSRECELPETFLWSQACSKRSMSIFVSTSSKIGRLMLPTNKSWVPRIHNTILCQLLRKRRYYL